MTSRINAIKQKISEDQIDALFITSPYNISYLTNLFPSSIEEREFYLFITQSNCYVIAPKMFLLSINEKTDGVNYIEITKDKSLYKIIEDIAKSENVKNVGFEENNLLYREFEQLTKRVKKIKLFPIENFVEEKRIIKDKDEIEKIKKACTLTDKAFDFILKEIREGVSETELSWKIENYFRQNNAQIAFSTIVAFGKNAAVPHHIPSDQKLTNNSFVLFDMGTKVDGYCSDMSRTIFFGSPNENEVKIYNTVKEAQEMALEKLNEWRSDDFEASHLHSISESHIEQMGFPPFPHSLGHGIGLQVHEEPSISKYTEGNPLEENSIITIEPGIYLPELGGVRIEDCVLLTSYGYEILTKSSKELIKIN